MPNYNGERFLKSAIDSVLAQTFQDWELLVIDDGSKDQSVRIIEDYSANDPRIKLLKTKFEKVAMGPAAARNTGIDAATGRYIAFLDSDDMWLPGKLSEQISFMQTKNIPFSFGWYDVINERGEKVGEKTPKAATVTYRRLLRDCVIGCLTAVYDTKLLGKQFINPHPRDRFADFSLWLKILKQTPKAYCLPQKLGLYRLVGGSISANKFQAAEHNWRLLREVEGLNLVAAIYYFSWYAAKGLLTKTKFIFRRERSGNI
jgi:teichuronic acid biosynthesis glycosyltransferase TuaG